MPIEIDQPGQSSGSSSGRTHEPRAVFPAMQAGFRQRCPRCGDGHLFNGYLKVHDTCAVCGQELHHQRADDAPPYVVMFITGHILVAGLLALEKAVKPEAWVHLAIWVPLTIVLSAWLLPRVKGALIGLQWANRMHGFDDTDDGNTIDPLTDPLAPKLAPANKTGHDKAS